MAILLSAIAFQIVFVGGGAIPLTDGAFTRIEVPDPIIPTPMDAALVNRCNAGRIAWVSAGFLHVTVALIAIIAAIACLHLTLPVFRRWRRFAIITLTLLLSCIVAYLFIQLPQRPITDQVVALVNRVHSTSATVASVIKFYDWLTYTTGIFLVSTCCLMLVEPDYSRNNKVPSLTQECIHLSRQARLLRLMLYIGTAVLITAIVRVGAFFDWASVLYSEPGKDPTFLQPVLHNTVMTWGTYSTLLLFAMYVPAFVILRTRSYNLVERAEPDLIQAEQEKWMKDRGLTMSSIEYFPKVAAILAPFVVGQFGEILKKLA